MVSGEITQKSSQQLRTRVALHQTHTSVLTIMTDPVQRTRMQPHAKAPHAFLLLYGDRDTASRTTSSSSHFTEKQTEHLGKA
eukprot:6464374-Amphidinium_carterae.1